MEGIELIVDDTRIEFRKELILEHPNLADRINRCLPEKLEKGSFYAFDVNGFVFFPFGAISLFAKDAEHPIASVNITEQTNYILGGHVCTRGEYFVRVCLGGGSG